MAQAPTRSLKDMLFGKGYGDNADAQEKERQKKAREEEEKRRKKQKDRDAPMGVRGSAAANDLYS